MTEIAYLNQFFLEHPSLLPVLDSISPRLPGLIYRRNEFEGGQHSSWYNRVGKNTMFCQNPNTFEFSKIVSDYSKFFNQSFDQVSDQRCVDLRQSHWHKPWVIMWSGGIDSTVIIASILRNLPPGDFENIQVWCNSTSVYENPRFFLDHIRPNFEVVSDLETMYMYRDVFLFAGESEYTLAFDRHKTHAKQSGFDSNGRNLLWANNRDHLVGYIENIGWPRTSNFEFSNWLYNAQEENIRSTGLPIHTISEWYWWLLFNLTYTSNIMQHCDQHCVKESHYRYCENFVPWFHSNEYQQWVLHNLNTVVRITNKAMSKQYIHSVFKDEHYLNFKTKVDSTSRPNNRVWFLRDFPHHHERRPRTWDLDFVQDDRVFCVLNNGDFLYLDRDLDQIVELLPQHINLDSLDYL